MRRAADSGQVGSERSALAPGGPHDHRDQCRRRPQLREVGADGRPGDPEVETVDQRDVEHDVGEVADHRHDQRGAGVLQTAQHPGGGHHHQQRNHPEEGPAQVRRGLVGDRGPGAEEVHQPTGQEHPGHRGRRPDQHRQPDAVDALGQRTTDVAGAEPAGDRRGGAVGQEHAQPDRGLDDRAGDHRDRPAPGCRGARRWRRRRAGTSARRPTRGRRAPRAAGSPGPGRAGRRGRWWPPTQSTVVSVIRRRLDPDRTTSRMAVCNQSILGEDHPDRRVLSTWRQVNARGVHGERNSFPGFSGPHGVDDVSAGQTGGGRHGGGFVHSGVNRLCTCPHACSTRPGGLSPGACGRPAFTWASGPVASALAVKSSGAARTVGACWKSLSRHATRRATHR